MIQIDLHGKNSFPCGQGVHVVFFLRVGASILRGKGPEFYKCVGNLISIYS